MKQWSRGGYRLDLGINFMAGSLTVAWNTQLLGLWTQRDVTLLTSVLKFPGVLLLWAHFIPRQPQELGMSETRKFLID